MKKHRFLCTALIIALLLALLPGEAFAASSDGTEVGGKQTEVNPLDLGITLEDALNGTIPLEIVTDPEVMEPLREESLKAALAEDGTCALKDGRYEKYIDRIDIPDELHDFYDLLVEGIDNDGENDFMITGQIDSELGFDVTTLSEDDISIDVYLCCSSPDYSLTAEEAADTSSEAYQAVNAAYQEYYEYLLAVEAAFDRDHPEAFWNYLPCIVLAESSTKSDGSCIYRFRIGIAPQLVWKGDYTSEAQVRSAIADVDAAAASIIAGASGSDAWVVKYFNNWLTTHNEYNYYVKNGDRDSAKQEAWECISALKGQTGYDGPVCEAYARALKVLCDRVGIPCVLVDGTAKSSASSSGGAHMWNYVKIGDTWYGVDVTWNDPTGGNAGAVSGYETERYLLVGKNTLNNKSYAFQYSHPVENYMYYNSVCFTNGPDIADEAYDFSAHTEHTADAGIVTQAAGCTSEGVMTYSCTVCGSQIKQESIAALGHDYQLTQLADGSYANVCTRCGDTAAPDYIPGDVNSDGVVDTNDITALRRYIVGGYDVTVDLRAANVNKDGAVATNDITALRRYIVSGYGVTLCYDE